MKSYIYREMVTDQYQAAGWALLLILFVAAHAAAEVAYSGLDERLEANVRAHSVLESTQCDAPSWRVERLFRDADTNIRTALAALGYYEPDISKSLRWSGDCWHAEFAIQPGAPVRFRNVDIGIHGAAVDDAVFQSRLTGIRPEPGDVLDHGQYEDYKHALMRAATHAGYFDGDYRESRILVDRENRAADMELQFDSGPKYSFGTVTFTDGILRQDLLARYTDIVPGQPYSAKSINDLYAALNGSSYFATVTIRTDPLDTETKTVPVKVELTPAKRRAYSVGGGYTTDNGIHGRASFANRRINENGRQLETRVYLSGVRSELDAAYRWPHRDPRQEWFSIVAGIQHKDTDSNRHDTYKLGILRARTRGDEWLETRYLDYAYEDFAVADQRETSRLLILGSNWESVTGRALSRATNGRRLSIDVRGAADSLVSDTSFLQLRTKAKWVRSAGDRARWITRASLGLTLKDSLAELPASVRFFAGGDRSVRGYEYETIGPVDADGNVTGGSHRVDASIEFDYLFKDSWSIAAFLDSGSAFNGSDIDLHTGVGIGVRWYSPVGPIRLDFAHPLDDPDNSFRIHVSLGPDL